jgi:hypothetical protein
MVSMLGTGASSPARAAVVGFISDAKATGLGIVCLVYQLPLLPTVYLRTCIFCLVHLLFVNLTHQTLTKLISSKFLLIGDLVYMILIISAFKKMCHLEKSC